jgi:hypothetical protein
MMSRLAALVARYRPASIYTPPCEPPADYWGPCERWGIYGDPCDPARNYWWPGRPLLPSRTCTLQKVSNPLGSHHGNLD